MRKSLHRVTGIVFRTENLMDERICGNEVFGRITSYGEVYQRSLTEYE
jgi:hypothetical protein